MPIWPIGSTGQIGAMCTNELMPIGPIGSIRPIGAICSIDADWSNWFHGPNWRDMYYVCQLGQLVPRSQLERYVSMNYCQLGQLVLSAQLARYVILIPIGPIGSTGLFGVICTNEFKPIGPIGSTGPIGAICLNELLPIGPIGSIGPIGEICTIYANWANWFHGPNWRDMYYVCQFGQLVPRAQLVRFVPMN